MKCPICDEETGIEIGGKPFCIFCESQSKHAQHLCCDCGKGLPTDLQGNNNPTSCHECADSYSGAAYREMDAVRCSVNYSEPTDTLQGCRESDRIAEGLQPNGKPQR